MKKKYFILIFLSSLLIPEQYFCSSGSGDSPTIYKRVIEDGMEFFTYEYEGSEPTFCLIVRETENHITLVNLVDSPIANLFVTFIDKNTYEYYERFLSTDSRYDSDKTVGQCTLRRW